MQRLHEDDPVGHVLAQEPWEVLSFPAIAETEEVRRIETIWGPRCDTAIRRWQGLTGGTARHAANGRSFDDLAREAEAANAV